MMSKQRQIMEMIKGKKVTFVRFQRNELFYSTECGFEFPVPVGDTGDAEFKSQDSAMFFMRWIRKQIKSIEEGKKLQE